MLFVFPGTPDEGRAFFERRWPEARGVSDPGLELYRGFGLDRGRAGQLFGPKVLAAGLKAVLGGHGLGRPQGDPFAMSGLFLVVEGERIAWSHPYEHAGDHPDFATLPRTLDEALERATGAARKGSRRPS